MRRYQNLGIADPAELCFGRRVMNQALTDGRDAALLYRKWLVESDAAFEP